MTGNVLIDSLPEDLQKALIPDLEAVELRRRGDTLVRGGEHFNYVYFPTTCMLSQVVGTTEGQTIEAMLVGRSGFIGAPLLMSEFHAAYDVIVQLPGTTLRMPAETCLRHLENHQFREALGRFALSMQREIAQSVACVAFHEVRERLARWLLLVNEATLSDEFALTHDYIGILLGAHRPTVSVAVGALVAASLIENSHTRIRILDVDGLVEAACDCYQRTHPVVES